MRTISTLLGAAIALLLLGLSSIQAQEVLQTPQEEQTAEPQPTLAPESEPVEPAVNESFERGWRFYRNRDFRQAREEFAKVIQMQPDRADAHYLIGYCHLMLRELQASLDAFHRCFAEDPNFDPRSIYQKPKDQ